MNNQILPANVPPELVRDYDYFDLAEQSDVYLHFKKLHDEPDLFYTPRNGGHWVVTRYEDMDAILSDAQRFSSKHQTLPKNPFVLPLIEYDGPIHADFRALLAPYFTPKSIGNLEKVSRDLTNSLIDGFLAQGECEFVRDFSQKMPIMILMSLLDLPAEDTPYLLKISEDIVRSGDPQTQQAAFARVFEYIATRVIPARRANPGNDIFSTVIKGQVEGRAVTDEELMGLGSLLIAAGLDTVAGMLGFITLFLAQSPEHLQQLINEPQLLNDALEELMRRHHLANLARVATCDVNWKGVTIKAGDCILIPTSAAGLDERRYPDAMAVDFRRGDKKTLVFGRGPHQCIGSFLARTELRVFMQEWLRRIPQFEIKAGEKPVAVAGKANSVQYLPLTWSVRG